MDYDIIILGGGIAGCSIAYELSKYNFNIAVIERDSDIIDDISEVNASIIYVFPYININAIIGKPINPLKILFNFILFSFHFIVI